MSFGSLLESLTTSLEYYRIKLSPTHSKMWKLLISTLSSLYCVWCNHDGKGPQDTSWYLWKFCRSEKILLCYNFTLHHTTKCYFLNKNLMSSFIQFYTLTRFYLLFFGITNVCFFIELFDLQLLWRIMT